MGIISETFVYIPFLSNQDFMESKAVFFSWLILFHVFSFLKGPWVEDGNCSKRKTVIGPLVQRPGSGNVC